MIGRGVDVMLNARSNVIENGGSWQFRTFNAMKLLTMSRLYYMCYLAASRSKFISMFCYRWVSSHYLGLGGGGATNEILFIGE